MIPKKLRAFQTRSCDQTRQVKPGNDGEEITFSPRAGRRWRATLAASRMRGLHRLRVGFAAPHPPRSARRPLPASGRKRGEVRLRRSVSWSVIPRSWQAFRTRSCGQTKRKRVRSARREAIACAVGAGLGGAAFVWAALGKSRGSMIARRTSRAPRSGVDDTTTMRWSM